MNYINGIKCYDKSDAILITSDMATEMLSKNRCIKRLDLDRVKKLEKELSSNNFNFNGATISLDKDGYLIDGQVRLQACKNTGISFLSLVVWGVDIQGQYTKDTGRSRNVIQIISKRGYENPKALYYCSLILNGILNSDGDTDGIKEKYDLNVTNQEILTIIDNAIDLDKSVNIIMKNKQSYMTSALYHLIVFDYLCRFIDNRPDIADEFLSVLNNTMRADIEHPVVMLRSILANSLYKSSSQLSKKKQIALMIKAYNLLKENKRCTKLHWIESTRMPSLYMISGE